MASTDNQLKRPLGKARFEMERGDSALAVRLDRQGFRRLVETLERLAETGERQTFGQSGRGRRRSGEALAAVTELVFQIEGENDR